MAVWGSGRPRREFLHVDDLADACVFLMDRYDELEHINVGTGEDLVDPRARRDACATSCIRASTLIFDPDKPDGMPRKLLDVSRLHALGWRHRIALRDGLEQTYKWFVDQLESDAAPPRGMPEPEQVR